MPFLCAWCTWNGKTVPRQMQSSFCLELSSEVCDTLAQYKSDYYTIITTNWVATFKH